MLDLIWSAISLLAFWLIGAVIFSALEGWSYG
jgi:potassium channel subfamily K